jgi:alpha-beta hydrolase superfamily lysophospholipase
LLFKIKIKKSSISNHHSLPLLLMKELSINAPNGLQLFARLWPVEPPKAVVVLVHGHGEHSGRYQWVAEQMNLQGYAVLAMDQQGHGLNSGERGVARMSGLIDDIGLWIAEAVKRYADTPVFLYGHSMGGQVALNYMFDEGRDHSMIKGFILTGPWFELTFPPKKFLMTVIKIGRQIFPDYKEHTGLNAAFISRDNDVVKAYQDDKLVHDYISLDLFSNLFNRGISYRNEVFVLPSPCLIMHGGDDRLTSSNASAAFAAAAQGDITYKIWPKLYHEIHQEPEKVQVLEYAFKWMEQKLKPIK